MGLCLIRTCLLLRLRSSASPPRSHHRPLYLRGLAVPGAEDWLRVVGTLCEAELHEWGGLPSKPKAPRVNGSKNPLAHCFRRARWVPEREFLTRRHWSEGMVRPHSPIAFGAGGRSLNGASRRRDTEAKE